MDTSGHITTLADAPSGSFDTKVDEQGRVKLNPEWVGFIRSQAKDHAKDGTAFVTTTGKDNTVKIYPWSAWKQNQARMEAMRPELRKALTLQLQTYGAECTPDAAGKLTLPIKLREKLNLAKGQVMVCWMDRGVLLMQAQSIYNASLAESEELLNQEENQKQLLAADLL